MSCISAQDPQLARLADAIAQRVGPQRFHVWFNNSTRLDLKQDGLEIAVPNDFISEWIGAHFAAPDPGRRPRGARLPAAGALQRRAAALRDARRQRQWPWPCRAAPQPAVVADPLHGASNVATPGRARSARRRPRRRHRRPRGPQRPGPSPASPATPAPARRLLARARASATTWTPSSSARATSSPTTPPPTSPSSPASSTTRCSSTAPAAWARPTCSRASASASSSTTRPSAGCT